MSERGPIAIAAAVVVVAAALLALALAPRAQAAAGLEIAAQDDFVFVQQGYYKRSSAFSRIGQFRAKWLRVNVGWSAANGRQARSRSKPKRIRYDWTAYDSLINEAAAAGVNLQLTLTGPAPAWAAGNKRIGPYKPNVSHWKNFVRSAVQHFSAHVNRYAIWNEPNLVSWLAPLSSAPKQYRSLYAAAYSEIKRGDPSAQVLIGETSPHATKRRSLAPVDFVAKMTKGGALKADGYAHHPYDLKNKPDHPYPGAKNATLATLGNLVGELDRQGASGKLRTPGGRPLDIWITEYGYLRAGRYRVSEGTRAQYLKKAYDMALAHPRVRQMLQYLLVQPTKKYAFFDMSLLNRSGKPFGAAFQALVDWSNAHQHEINGRVPGGGGGGSGGGGGGGGGGGTNPPPPSCAPLPVCPTTL